MLYLAAAVERAMKVQEVILRALSGTLTWLQAADILGIHPRSLRRWRARYEGDGVLGLYDRRCQRPSRRTAPVAEVQRVLRLYRDTYLGFNVRHFHHLARRDHGVPLYELRLADISTVAAANAYLRERFLPEYTELFTRPPAEPTPAFVPLHGVDLAQILCHEEERTVAQDNTVVLERVCLQLAKQPGRRTCARLRVTVRRHLEGQHTVWRGTQCLGRYAAQGHPLPATAKGPPGRLRPFRDTLEPFRPKNARAHWAQERSSRGRQGYGIPPSRSRRRTRTRPRLPLGPSE